ncbi:hypothetical protein P5673_013620 [Acropora cervicornis]|uniref:Uncharacterized protein n=1 Tax=Acropora cervicornis TaxID=6130 RepID=A0AAD9QLC5_ACRCE|nr:hypothetical protein P5673_013620 [Acropora cervicornis]
MESRNLELGTLRHHSQIVVRRYDTLTSEPKAWPHRVQAGRLEGALVLTNKLWQKLWEMFGEATFMLVS